MTEQACPVLVVATNRAGRSQRFRAALRAISMAATLTVCVSAHAGERMFSPPVERYELANGLKVRLAPDPSLEEVTAVVHYDVGSADDPAGKEGLAHLVEHLMFDGSRHVGPGDYSRFLAQAGGTSVNGTTALDATNFVVTVPPGGLPVVFWLESDRMGFLEDRINQKTLDREKRLIEDETRDRLLDRNLGIAGRAGWMQLFPAQHPYRGQLRLGLDGCTLDDVGAFRRTWYVPANATLGVAGNFDVATVRPLIEQYFGDLPGDRPPERPPLPDTWSVHDVRIDVGAGIARDIVTFMWMAPALDKPGDAALDLAATILADPEGRLQRALVATGLAASVSSRESSWQRASAFWISADLSAETADDQVVEAFDRAVRELAAQVAPEEYERAHAEWLDGQMLGLETSTGRAFRLVRKGAPAIPWELDKYDGIGPDEVARAVRSILTPDHRVVVVVHHDGHYPAQGVVLSRMPRLP